MTRWLGLLRGINVSGTRKLPMVELRALCGELGFTDAKTYIASGNVMFSSADQAETVTNALEKGIADRFGFSCDVIVRSAAQWRTHLENNPFANDETIVPKMLHIMLSRHPLKPGAVDVIRERLSPTERIRASGGVLWIDYGESGVARSKLTPSFLDKTAGSTVTGRNLNTAEMLDQLLNGTT